jgi:hypothetical protein
MFDSQVADLDAVGAAGAVPVVVARVHPVPVPDFARRRVGGPQVSPGSPVHGGILRVELLVQPRRGDEVGAHRQISMR